ncbi:MAG: hypothetical protein O7C59_08010 [Rickettsia endosymbiont of Ixodes persulcatus]|nr:hypothetical protein [Rickettsia endosymbiont of Ixodes persulcatus]
MYQPKEQEEGEDDEKEADLSDPLQYFDFSSIMGKIEPSIKSLAIELHPKSFEKRRGQFVAALLLEYQSNPYDEDKVIVISEEGFDSSYKLRDLNKIRDENEKVLFYIIYRNDDCDKPWFLRWIKRAKSNDIRVGSSYCFFESNKISSVTRIIRTLKEE